MDEIKKNTIPRWLQICLLVGSVALIVIGLFKIFGGSSTSSNFLDKFNELQAPTAEIKSDFASVASLLSGIGAKETGKDYTGINSDLQTSLAKLNNVVTKIASTQTAFAEFQNMVNNSSDQNVKTTGMHFIDVFKLRNVTALKMVNDAKDLVNQAITYYSEVFHNQKVTIDVNKFSAAASTFNVNAQGMTSIGTQYDAAANDFAKAAGFTIEKK